MGYISKCIYVAPERNDSEVDHPERTNYLGNERTSWEIQRELDKGEEEDWKLHSCQPLPYSNSFLLIWEKE